MKDFVVGGLVRGDDFCFRETFIGDLWSTLRKNNVLLLSPRRMGKTSVMNHLLDSPQDDHLPVYVNVEDLEDSGDFILLLLDELNERYPKYVRDYLVKGWGVLKKVFERIKEIEALELKIALKESGIKENWRENADQLLSRLKTGEKKIVFLVDELPDMLTSMKRVGSAAELDIFLHWFRKIRTEPQSNVRWLCAGSTNIEGTLGQLGKLQLINDFEKVILPPFTDEEVSSFVVEMLGQHAVEFEPDVIPAIQELIGRAIPFFLQLLTQELYRYWKYGDKQKLTSADVDVVYRRALMGVAARDKLQHFRSRIDIYYPADDRDAASRLLGRLSRCSEGVSRRSLFTLYSQIEQEKLQQRVGSDLEQAFNRLVLLMESDFYIEEGPDELYDFSSSLLKLWWRKHYGYRS